MSEILRKFLPTHLEKNTNKEIFETINNLRQIFVSRPYKYQLTDTDIISQGDLILDMSYYSFQRSMQFKRTGIIISNTCDINPANKRPYKTDVIYCPIMTVEGFIQMLKSDKIEESRIKNLISDIINQKITTMMYLPSSSVVGDSIIFLDKAQSCEAAYFYDQELLNRRKVTLSRDGWYLLLFKLSVHFTRMTDQIDRTAV